jgi:hypothetical protein
MQRLGPGPAHLKPATPTRAQDSRRLKMIGALPLLN